jgi:hypothetical protein
MEILLNNIVEVAISIQKQSKWFTNQTERALVLFEYPDIQEAL